MRAYTRHRMSFQPRAGISEGVVASRPRSASKAAAGRLPAAAANRRRRNPRSSSAAVTAVTQIGMGERSERSALTMPGLRRRFSFARFLAQGRRRGHALVAGLRKLGSAGEGLFLGLVLCFLVGLLGNGFGFFLLFRRERMRPLLELIAGLA